MDILPPEITADEGNSALAQRRADARAWLGELFPSARLLGESGAIRLALLDRSALAGVGAGWDELLPFRAGRGPFADATHDELLDVLAASIVAAADRGLDVFASPYAHGTRHRHKGGAVARRHVHADVDGPLDLQRLRALGGWAVASGSTSIDGQPHGHAYMRLSRSIERHEHEALCRALGARVGGEAHDESKVGDADVLRPVGSINHKRGESRPVSWLVRPDEPGVRTWDPELLARLLGVGWPIADPAATAADDGVLDGDGIDGIVRDRLDGDRGDRERMTARRADALVREVAEAPPGEGNARLLWAACRVIESGAEPAAAEHELLDRLAETFADRPSRESRMQRLAEAHRTIASARDLVTRSPRSDDTRELPTVELLDRDDADDESAVEPELIDLGALDTADTHDTAADAVTTGDTMPTAPQPGPVTATTDERWAAGGAFVFDGADRVATIWGSGEVVPWAEGESLMLYGPIGVGKSTLAGLLLRGRLGLVDEVLGMGVVPGAGRVLYLAMDRPRQLARALRRQFAPSERETLDARLVVWRGPLPQRLVSTPTLLRDMAREAGADTIVVDSVKDAATKLADDEGGQSYNTARQHALADGIELIELHHPRKAGSEGRKRLVLDDLYGSTWIGAGAGGVVVLDGSPESDAVEVYSVKSPEGLLSLRAVIDRRAGTLTLDDHADDEPLASRVMDALTAQRGVAITAPDLARSLFHGDDRAQAQRVRRELDALVSVGAAERVDLPPTGGRGGGGGRVRAGFRAAQAGLSAADGGAS